MNTNSESNDDISAALRILLHPSAASAAPGNNNINTTITQSASSPPEPQAVPQVGGAPAPQLLQQLEAGVGHTTVVSTTNVGNVLMAQLAQQQQLQRAQQQPLLLQRNLPSQSQPVNGNDLNVLLSAQLRGSNAAPVVGDKNTLLQALLVNAQNQLPQNPQQLLTMPTINPAANITLPSQALMNTQFVPMNFASASQGAMVTANASAGPKMIATGPTAAAGTSSSSQSPPGKPRREKFPDKLYRMLTEVENDNRDDIISFTATGKAFEIHQPDVFEEEVLPEYFSHGKLASFKRQLHLYGFALINHGPDAGAYYHPMLQRGDEEACRHIARLK